MISAVLLLFDLLEEEAAFEARVKVLEDEETPLNLANAINAFLGFDKFSKSVALLLEVVDELPVIDEDGPFRNACEVSMRGWSN